jgi:hypothetical protein
VTLPELLVAMTIGLITVLAVLAVLDTSVTQSNAVAGRVDATQRGRGAMDQITTELRSQVCYSPIVAALVSATDNSVKFHADLSDGSRLLEQRELVFDPAAKTIVEKTWAGVGSPVTFPKLTRSRQLLDDVTSRPAPDAAMFRYYAYNSATPPRPVLQLPTPLSATDLARTARIEVGFITLPPVDASAETALTLQNDVYVRAADPNDPAPTPTCA